MLRKDAYEKKARFNNAVQAIPKNSNKIYDAFELFEEWKPGVSLKVGAKLRFKNYLYSVEQAHTSQADWTPDVVPAMFSMIPRPGESGDAEHPIEYNNNMRLEEGKYYIQYEVEYYCFRDTINPVYNPLAELVGLYVNVYSG